jgi:hypothetical protein
MKKNFLSISFSIIFIALFSIETNAQTSKSPLVKSEILELYEDSIQFWAYKMLKDPNEYERYESNKQLERVLEKCLVLKEVLIYPFEKVKSIGILSPPDKSFRIFNWHFKKDNGTYFFFGYIVKETQRGIEFFKLNDIGLQDPVLEYKSYNYKDWPGAHYYEVIKADKKENKYLLLGWNGNNPMSTKKVIEVLHFKDNIPHFGYPVFKTEKRNQTRVVFEYTKEASMSLKYNEKKQWIIFDNLSPREPQLEGMFSFYGPDFSINALKYIKGKWILEKDIDITNDKPKKKKTYNAPN